MGKAVVMMLPRVSMREPDAGPNCDTRWLGLIKKRCAGTLERSPIVPRLEVRDS
uniref:Uncharacterized protein n=1 Tax=Siphoviridae sp. ctixZ6 TaxID=2826437 RepID=A0A8S5N737_9CAUD|nr:MAG TPA: hypothetical protein [Siphoviridae sp. ctixZ6]